MFYSHPSLGERIEKTRKYGIGCLIEDCDLPPLLTQRKYANFKDNYTMGYLELIETIQYRANK
jgi:hypothetical protein